MNIEPMQEERLFEEHVPLFLIHSYEILEDKDLYSVRVPNMIYPVETFPRQKDKLERQTLGAYLEWWNKSKYSFDFYGRPLFSIKNIYGGIDYRSYDCWPIGTRAIDIRRAILTFARINRNFNYHLGDYQSPYTLRDVIDMFMAKETEEAKNLQFDDRYRRLTAEHRCEQLENMLAIENRAHRRTRERLQGLLFDLHRDECVEYVRQCQEYYDKADAMYNERCPTHDRLFQQRLSGEITTEESDRILADLDRPLNQAHSAAQNYEKKRLVEIFGKDHELFDRHSIEKFLKTL